MRIQVNLSGTKVMYQSVLIPRQVVWALGGNYILIIDEDTGQFEWYKGDVPVCVNPQTSSVGIGWELHLDHR